MVKIVYLTIDDGPSRYAKRKIDYLVSKEMPAIWFCRGDNLEKRPELGIYLIKHGFILGNHTYNHPHFSKLPLEECLEQIKKTDEMIDNLYKQAGIKRPAKVFRFSYGDKGGGDNFQSLQDFLKKSGYSQPKFKGINYKWFDDAGLLKDVDVYWTYDVMEWAIGGLYVRYIKTPKDVFKRMEENVPEGGRGLNFQGSNEIILLHDHIRTTKLFFKIMDKLIGKKLTFRLPDL